MLTTPTATAHKPIWRVKRGTKSTCFTSRQNSKKKRLMGMTVTPWSLLKSMRNKTNHSKESRAKSQKTELILNFHWKVTNVKFKPLALMKMPTKRLLWLFLELTRLATSLHKLTILIKRTFRSLNINNQINKLMAILCCNYKKLTLV